MKTYRQVLIETEQTLIKAAVFCGHGYESEHDEAVALVLAAAELPDNTGAEILDETMPEAALLQLADWVSKRTEERIPVAYLTGWAWLGPLKFRSDSRALVPRSPLMSVVMDGFEPWYHGPVDHVVDVCCGGGSLGLLAAAGLPETKVTLLDIDDDALSLARENRQLTGLDSVTIAKSDLLAVLPDACCDVVLANPPYVDAQDMADLPPEYRHEPSLALEAGADGLDLVHRLLAEACRVLRPEGVLFLEVGNSWPALEASYPQVPFYWLELPCGGHGVCVINKGELSNLIRPADSNT